MWSVFYIVISAFQLIFMCMAWVVSRHDLAKQSEYQRKIQAELTYAQHKGTFWWLLFFGVFSIVIWGINASMQLITVVAWIVGSILGAASIVVCWLFLRDMKKQGGSE